MTHQYHYMKGFQNHFFSEALPHALPQHQNNPQKVPYGLYAEQLSGSAFTAALKENFRSWLYRIQPSVVHGPHKKYQHELLTNPPFAHEIPPTQMRWNPLPYPDNELDFIDSLVTFVGNGNASQRSGGVVYHYATTASMQDHYFYNADGDLLIVPQEGGLLLKTELGIIDVVPGEIAVIQRGIKFQVALLKGKARGYVCENFGLPFTIPNLGPIGPNGLANSRDFSTPLAHYEEKRGDFTLISKYQGVMWSCPIDHSPLDVVAWHGNYAPYKYNLAHFNAIYSVSYDHTDPSIFTVLTSPSTIPGIANIDFVIFPSRWVVMEHTMRLPYFHRNIMNEYMGLITGDYDAKQSKFVAGGSSLHNCMIPHGPDADSYHKALAAKLQPDYYKNTMAIMFESSYPWQVSQFALTSNLRDMQYLDSWQSLGPTFDKSSCE